MLDNWLTPIHAESLLQIAADHPQHLGAHLLDQTETPEKVRVALIGSEASGTESIRKALYQLACHTPNLAVADLGNLRKPELDFAIQLLRELQASHIIPIFLAPDLKFIQALFRGQAQKQLNMGLFAQSPGFEVIEGKVHGPMASIAKDPDLANFSLIGGQAHYIDATTMQWMENRHFEQLRLGSLRSNLAAAEPYIRDTDLVAVQLNFLKQIEAPAQHPPSPSGLFSEEACQLMRYAGMSDKLCGIGFFGYDLQSGDQDQTAAVLAQLIWYFIEGVDNRKGDFPVSKKNLIEYIVQTREWNVPLVFWKSNKSGRWWMQIPEQKRKLGKRHFLVPCSYENYVSCTNDEIPDRLIRILRRFD